MEQLLQRYIRGKVSEEERLKVVSWLDENPDNMREFLALRKLYDISLWHTDTEQKHFIKIHSTNSTYRNRNTKNSSDLFNWNFCY